MTSKIVLPPTLQFLKFSTRLSGSKLDLSEQEHEAACFTERLARKHPCLQRLEINYGIYWTGMYSVVWGRIRKNMDVGAQEVAPMASDGAKNNEVSSTTTEKGMEGSYSSKSSSKDFILSTIVSTVHPLPLGKLTFTEHRRTILFQNLKSTSARNRIEGRSGESIWAMTWRRLRRLLRRFQ
jgi:hypothetical protein